MIRHKKRVVVKVGTSSFTGKRETLQESNPVLEALVKEICALVQAGHEMILVTSGAIGAGMKELGWTKRPEDLRKKQAAAAVGQVTLMQTYQKLFRAHGTHVAQVLLTRDDFEDRRRYLNARSTLLNLLEMGVVPVINENDTVAVEEIQFGDNDRLSALVAAKIDADLLIILSNVDGLIREEGGKKEVVSLIPKITPEIEKLAWRGVKSELGTGGMTSKIEAAKVTTASGITTHIANANRKHILTDILEGKPVGTKFVSIRSMPAKDKWILFGALPKGEIIVDSGAGAALKEMKKSLLPAGVIRVNGTFHKGAVVSVKTDGQPEFARGIAAFSSHQIEAVKGLKSADVKKQLGARPEIIHRDSLALLP